MTVRYALLSSISGFISLAFSIGALVVVVVQRHRLGPRAARLAIGGTALLLAGIVLSIVTPMALSGIVSRIDSSMDSVSLFILASLIIGLVHLGAITLLLMALFADRAPSAGWIAPVGGDPLGSGPVVLPPTASGPPPAPGGIPPWPAPDES